MNYKIILASNSPRRRELLAGLDIPFEVRVLPSVDESYPASLRAGEIPLFISREKANAYRDMIAPDELIITADTIVWLEDAILEKPHDDAEAVAMLHRLWARRTRCLRASPLPPVIIRRALWLSRK